MPFAFLLLGSMFVIAGVRGKDEQLFTLIKGDFSGKPSFLSWMVAVLLIGALGYIEPIKPISRALLVLIVIVLFLTNGGFFQKFTQGVEAPAAASGQPASLQGPVVNQDYAANLRKKLGL